LKGWIGNNNIDVINSFEIEGLVQFLFTSAHELTLLDNDYVNSMQNYLQSVAPDCEITPEGNDNGFRCHGRILKERSEVIKGDLEKYRDSRNAEGGFVHITPPSFITSTGVNALLRYLYYRDIEVIRYNLKVAFELLQAADYYRIPRLTDDCKDILQTTTAGIVDTETLIELFKFLRLKEDMKELRTKVGQTIKL
jgi:hypothetical protein